MFKNILAIYVALVLFIGVSGNTMAKDAHSYANLEEVSSRHLHLDLTVDFDKKTLSGYAEYDIVRHSAAASSFIVDTRDLTINRVEVLGEDWQPTTFTLAAPEAVLGAKLTIALPDNAQKVRIYYRTSPDAAGLQWLTPQQTAGNTGIYGEKYILEAAAAEFADTYEMVKVAEKLYGPYQWGRYDILMMPPSYPMGGMENPMLSFITPTVVAGDKSLVDLIAHELDGASMVAFHYQSARKNGGWAHGATG